MVPLEAAVEVILEMITTIRKVIIDHNTIKEKEAVIEVKVVKLESLSTPATKTGTSVKMARSSRPIACIKDPPEEVEAMEMRATDPQPDFPTIYLFKRTETSLISQSSDGNPLCLKRSTPSQAAST